MTTHFSLEPHGIRVNTIYRNLSPATLYEHALEHDPLEVLVHGAM